MRILSDALPLRRMQRPSFASSLPSPPSPRPRSDRVVVREYMDPAAIKAGVHLHVASGRWHGNGKEEQKQEQRLGMLMHLLPVD